MSTSKKNEPEYIDSTVKDDAKARLLAMGDKKVGRELFHMLLSHYRVLYIRSHEECRVMRCFHHMSILKGYEMFRWDLSRGMCDVATEKSIADANSEMNTDPMAALAYIIDCAKNDAKKRKKDKKDLSAPSIFFLLDFYNFLEGNPLAERRIKEFSMIPSMVYIVIISPVYVCPPSLEKVMTLIDFPLPSSEEIRERLDKVLDDTADRHPEAKKAIKNREEEVVKAAKGLTLDEARSAYCRSLVKTKGMDIATILEEKKQIIRKSGVLEYLDPQFSFDDVGGLDAIKDWLQLRKLAFKEDAKEFGLPNPRGVLLAGIPGAGKSLIAQALASFYEMPLLRLDMGSVFASHIGESEQNIRSAVHMAETVAPCIMWVDEVEKGIGGVQSSNQTDGGVTNRVFGTLLTWLQEKKEAVFVIATANNVEGIPPEFMRAGRFDEIFFLDLPNIEQRLDVIEKLLKRKNRKPDDFNLVEIAEACDKYSPAEIEKAIDNALFAAYSDGKRLLVTDDVVVEFGRFQPLYNTRREDIENMRNWALGADGKGGRARLANSCSKKIVAKPTDEPKIMIDNDSLDEL